MDKEIAEFERQFTELSKQFGALRVAYNKLKVQDLNRKRTLQAEKDRQLQSAYMNIQR